MKCFQVTSLVFILAFTSQINGQAHYLKFHQNVDKSCAILDNTFMPKYRGFKTSNANELKIYTKPSIKPPAHSSVSFSNDDEITEVFAKTDATANAYLESRCKSHFPQKYQPNFKHAIPEVRKIVDGGDPLNRIDIVFMGDGYTLSERGQFFSDMERLTNDMFSGVTFRSYLPLFNIWAVYVGSEVSGIGYDGEPLNTPFKLYREKGQLRIIWVGDPEMGRQVCALTGHAACDFPSLIGNDDFMGGLGGEFVVSTKGNRTGTLTVRHEMGHNFMWAGDEYDNSPTYMGVNYAESVESLGWTHWLTSGQREERAIYRLLAYPWTDLSNGSIQSFNFSSDGTYSRWHLDLTVSAAGEEDCLEFTLDGKVLPWKTTGFDDREFYSWKGNEGFSEGDHVLTVRSKTRPTHPKINRMICQITLHEFGSESKFEIGNDHVSAYPTWGEKREKVFRPTNAGCLMRNVTHDRFCPVCQEGIWLKFLERVSIIDSVEMGNSTENGMREVKLDTLKLGQFRIEGERIKGEKLEIRWALDSREQPEFDDKLVIMAEPGVWTVKVKFVTNEIRHDHDGLTTSTETIVVPSVN